MLQQFKDFVKSDLTQVSFPGLIDKVEMIDLDSSTPEKFSHHLIINMYHEGYSVFFQDNLHVGKYVQKLIEKLCLSKIESLRLPDKDEENSGGRSEKFFIDEAVYSKNRNFRTYLSSKCGKAAILKRASEDDNSNWSEREFFLKVRFLERFASRYLRKSMVKSDL